MLAVGWYENAQVDTALTRALALQRDVEQLNEMQLASSRGGRGAGPLGAG